MTFTNYLRSIRIIHFNNKTFIPIDINNIAKTRFNRFTSNIFSASNYNIIKNIFKISIIQNFKLLFKRTTPITINYY